MSAWLKQPLFHLGQLAITPEMLLYLPVGFLVVLVISDLITRLVVARILRRTRLDEGTGHAIGTITRYILIVVGMLAVFEEAGINFTALHFFAGALGVGVGFGLNFLVTDFFSGLLLLFERTLKVGDRLEVDGVVGNITNIGYRATTLVTNDLKAHIIPNNKLVSNRVINWTLKDPTIRFSVFVSVGYDSDETLVERLLLQAAAEDDRVLKDPDPKVLLHEFGTDGLVFELRVWNQADVRSPETLESRLNLRILKSFRAHDIEFPNRQSDVYIRKMVGFQPSSPESIET